METSRRQSYTPGSAVTVSTAHPPPPPPHTHTHPHPHTHPPPPPHHYHHSAPPQPHSAQPPPPQQYPIYHPPPSVDHRPSGPPPPPPNFGQPPAPLPSHGPSPVITYPGQPVHSAPGPSLPPIHHPPGLPTSQQEPPQSSLPPFRHPSHAHPQEQQQQQQQQQSQPQREPPEYHSYHAQHDRSGHATPAPVSRSFSHDSPPQRTPTTPAIAGPPPPPSAAPNGIPHQSPVTPMDPSTYHAYPPPNGVAAQIPAEAPQQYPQHMLDGSSGYAPPSSQVMYGQATQYGSGSAFIPQSLQGKRKQMRATQACEQCRQRKQKCDEGNPCSFCKENNMSCQYRDTPPAKVDKNMERLLSYMEQHSAKMEQHSAMMATLTQKVDGINQRLLRVEQQAMPNAGKHEEEAPEPDVPMHDDVPVARTSEVDDHRTAPHKFMLWWPSIRKVLDASGCKVKEGYVAEAEDRPILRLYTKGEGIDEHDGTQPGGPASPARSEDSGDGMSATPPDGLWGTGLPQTPNSDVRRSEPHGLGGLKPNGSPDLDVATINALYDSYMKHIHVMHPFLDKSRLRKLVDHFIKRYSPGQNGLRPKYVMTNGTESERPLKRQRSNGPGAPGMSSYENNHIRRDYHQIERSPSNAVVWLVLALGKICLHKESLPPIVPDGNPSANSKIQHELHAMSMIGSSPALGAAIKPSPMSPKATPMTNPTPPSFDGINPSRRSSLDGTPSTGTRNIDIIPGLAYYAKAVEVLGDQGDGNDLIHAQMFLLAGLYKGQLARVKESMSWITMAGRAIMNLLDRYGLYNENYWSTSGDVKKHHEKGQARIKDKRHSLIVLASWTALQLESDILAELRLPSSGIQTRENMLLMPHDMSENEKENYDGLDTDGNQESYDTLLLYYTAQLFLRRKLNQVHKEMYSNYAENQSLDQVRDMLLGHDEILNLWRDSLPEQLQWEDEDEPPSEMLSARLRAKYWGARYVINRPFLDYCLHIMPLVNKGHPIETIPADAEGRMRAPAEIQVFKAIRLMGDDTIWAKAKTCINAAMHSTVAFDGIEGRLWITNIHGTAHAQFGNMLVLSAAFHSEITREHVGLQNCSSLLLRTIKFLRKYAAISKTCKLDAGILEMIQKFLFPHQDSQGAYLDEGYIPGSTATSFSRST